jgi:cytosine deaminase
MPNPADSTTAVVLRRARLPFDLLSVPGCLDGQRRGDLLECDLLLAQGRILDRREDRSIPESARVIELDGRIVLPRFVEPHVHLDKCHTISPLDGVGGDLLHAIEAQARDQSNWDAADISLRASRGIEELIASGCRIARTHIDWPAIQPPLAWHVIGELAQEHSASFTLQRAALIGLERFDDLGDARQLVRYVADGNGVLSVFVRGQPDLRRRLSVVFELAELFSLALDFHTDEDVGMQPSGLQAIAEVASESGFEGPIVCGHACSLINVEGDQLERLIDAIVKAAIAVVALPSTNLYLQGRGCGTPVQRGITRVKELDSAGVTVAFGADNVADPFCPFGRFDPLESLALGALVAHLDPPYGAWLKTITSEPEQALGVSQVPLERRGIADLLVMEATHSAELLRSPARSELRAFVATFESS